MAVNLLLIIMVLLGALVEPPGRDRVLEARISSGETQTAVFTVRASGGDFVLQSPEGEARLQPLNQGKTLFRYSEPGFETRLNLADAIPRFSSLSLSKAANIDLKLKDGSTIAVRKQQGVLILTHAPVTKPGDVYEEPLRVEIRLLPASSPGKSK